MDLRDRPRPASERGANPRQSGHEAINSIRPRRGRFRKDDTSLGPVIGATRFLGRGHDEQLALVGLLKELLSGELCSGLANAVV
jgi:hypothetical protein